jgi:hypothetical protein
MSQSTIPLERDSRQSSAVDRPAEGKPTLTGVVSLLDMQRLYGDFFLRALMEMQEMRNWRETDGIIPFGNAVAGKLSALELESATQGLTGTAQKCRRIMNKCHEQRVTYREIVTDLGHLKETLEDEMRSHVFLHLTLKEAEWYEKPDNEWHVVISRFYKLRHDIEESSKCFALGRYAASLFHVLLVAEFGIIKVAELFGASGNRPGWGDLERLQRINDKKWGDKTPLEQQHAEFLKNLLPMAFAIKDSWRHKISHVDNKLDWMDTDFSPEVAGEIISATRGFMRRLAKDLPK